MKTHTSKVLEICENGDAIIELPDELMEEMGWKVGDVLRYELKDEKVFIKNISINDTDRHEQQGTDTVPKQD
jgi:bifunctional DNA-binding transcriptional regulator/antitoxin component of YhaV-PrlF toxin-antitoxin module